VFELPLLGAEEAVRVGSRDGGEAARGVLESGLFPPSTPCFPGSAEQVVNHLKKWKIWFALRIWI